MGFFDPASGVLKTMIRYRFCLAALPLCAVMLPHHLPAAEKPNVVVILSDDQGWGDLSLNGNTNLSTPHVDSLARDGATLRGERS